MAVGTSASPIVFEFMDATPVYNAWQGLELTASGVNSLQGTTLAYCKISNATGYVTAIPDGNAAGSITVDGSDVPGANGPPIANCDFVNYGGCGIFTKAIDNAPIYGVNDTPDAGNAFTPSPNAPGPPLVLMDVCSI